MKKILSVIILFFISVSASVYSEENPQEQNKTSKLFEEVEILSDAISVILTDYVEEVKPKELVYGAIRGITGTLDGYSLFLDPEEFKEISEETRGEFGGIGIQIGTKDGLLKVIAPMEDTPAFKAGVKAGDIIVKINDEMTKNMTLNDAVKKLRGKSGTEVTITIIRDGSNSTFDYKMIRSAIKVKSIKEFKMIESAIGYVRIVEFQERTKDDLENVVKKLISEGAKGLIIDLRNNPGGLLDSAIEISELFLKKNELIVYMEGRTPSSKAEFRSKNDPVFSDIKLIFLINGGSASASEILAGAIKDNKRGILVGETSFGKGSIQTIVPLKDLSAVRLTTAAYFTPSGKSLMNNGITPDIEIKTRAVSKNIHIKKDDIFNEFDNKEKLKETLKEKEISIEEDNIDFEHDIQLKTAVNILKGISIFESITPKNAIRHDK
ncbi:carboxyl-terminal protease [Candidatus Omnitrophus magneticus]|uniref:Carboxyl-terminal protease n=1 Tax=Candidatus Omnitrophus magneticus TaxID=1609969 RepID=A0A0F0CQB0_9BACT|nr:carboxyl-terminal protease [Candidatus Omnitrophus magneticus]